MAELDNPSWSKSIIETVNGSHQFVIKGFSLAKGMGNGKYVSSDVFTIGGHHWSVYFYPDGKNPEDNSVYVSVFIALASEAADVRALFELTMVDQSGKERHKVHSHFDRALEDGPYTLKYKGSMWGYKRFYKRTSLETSDYLKDDTLILNCKVGVVRNRIEKPRPFCISVPESDIGRGMLEILTSGIGCDITFEVSDENIRAHRQILAARSPVFKAMFFGPIGNPNLDKLIIDDIEPIIFKAMINYIYTDELSLKEEEVVSCSSADTTFAILIQHLLAAADKYGLERLKTMCEANLCQRLTAGTVATTLALAEQHHFVELKTACLVFTASNLSVVMQSEGFGYLKRMCPDLIADLLATVADVARDVSATSASGYKRSLSNFVNVNTELNLSSDSNNRRVRRRM